MSKNDKDINFEENMKELEEIVNALLESNYNLSESLELYTRGIGLYKECREYLNKVKGEVKYIMDDNLLDYEMDDIIEE